MGGWLRPPSPDSDKYKKDLLTDDSLDISQREDLEKELGLNSPLDENIKTLELMVGPSEDFVIRRIRVGKSQVRAAVIHLEELSDSNKVERLVKNLCFDLLETEQITASGADDLFESIQQRLLSLGHTKEGRKFIEVWDSLAGGYAAVFFDGVDRALLCNTQGFEKRAVEEPASETVIRGPRSGFIESIGANISLLRRFIKSPNLWFESYTLGSLTRTKVAMAYIKGLASEELIKEVRQRVSRIDIDGILESGHIEEFIEDEHKCPFPLIFRTERPDRVAANLLEGRVAIVVDNTPFVLVVPMDYHMLLQAPDDYYEKVPIGSFLRVIRLVGFWVSILLPGVYVATVNFHNEIFPTSLILKIASTREGVPFPVAFEVFIMEFVFELLREAGIRLPRVIGPAISIVGALVLGEAAIQAGLVSPAVVIVVALTAISSFTTPTFSLGIAARLIRFVFIILGSVFGLFGIQFGFLYLIISLASYRSFGYPYMLSAAPMIVEDWKDLYLRTWFWDRIKRPKLTGAREPVRARPGQKPGPGRAPEQSGQKKVVDAKAGKKKK